MYGMILSNMSEYIKKTFGPGKWKEVREKLDIKEDTYGLDNWQDYPLSSLNHDRFIINESFPEGQVIKMGKTAMKLLGLGDEEFYEGMGVFFVTLAQELGYGMLLSCLGRYFRDFFVNLDNLHDYLKFTFPR